MAKTARTGSSRVHLPSTSRPGAQDDECEHHQPRRRHCVAEHADDRAGEGGWFEDQRRVVVDGGAVGCRVALPNLHHHVDQSASEDGGLPIGQSIGRSNWWFGRSVLWDGTDQLTQTAGRSQHRKLRVWPGWAGCNSVGRGAIFDRHAGLTQRHCGLGRQVQDEQVSEGPSHVESLAWALFHGCGGGPQQWARWRFWTSAHYKLHNMARRRW